jgi:di/tricarboxylate transporter
MLSRFRLYDEKVLPALSLGALVLVIVLSCFTRLHVGILAIAFAWIIGLLAGLSPNQIMAGFPSSLFLTLTGVSLLFTQAEVNGTLERLAHALTSLAHGRAIYFLLIFFVFSAALSTFGAGALSTAALAAPLAMGAASRAGISPFLMALIIGNGANAGNLSPVSPVGVVVIQTLDRLQLASLAWTLYRNHLFAHLLLAMLILVCFGGRSLFTASLTPSLDPQPWQRHNLITLLTLVLLLLGVLLFQLPVGLAAFAAVALLTLLRCAPEDQVLARVPWSIILLVSGMSLLIALLERTGGLDLFTSLMARFSTIDTSTAVVAFVAGIVSAYSSTSGVVLPAFLPMAPKLVAQLGGGDVTALLSSISLGSHLVDVSPLSTIGALCVASAGPEVDRNRLFRQLLLWGLSMSVIGAIASYFFFGKGWL